MFQSFFCWKGHQIFQRGHLTRAPLRFQSFFCWKGHQIPFIDWYAYTNGMSFNPFSAGRGIKSANLRKLGFPLFAVSILFLLERASNPLLPKDLPRILFRFQSFFCWKGHQIRLCRKVYTLFPLVSILFLLEGASNHPDTPSPQTRPRVSILFLLEGASNHQQ